MAAGDDTLQLIEGLSASPQSDPDDWSRLLLSDRPRLDPADLSGSSTFVELHRFNTLRFVSGSVCFQAIANIACGSAVTAVSASDSHISRLAGTTLDCSISS